MAYLAVGVGIFLFHSAWGALAGFHAAILLSLSIARPNIPIAVLLKSTKTKWILSSVLLCGSSGVGLYYLWGIFGFADDLSAQVQALGLTSSTWLPFIAYFTLVNPFVEEYFWRGYLGSDTKMPHVSDFVYSGFHVLVLIGKVQTGSILFGLSMLALAGWFWRQVTREDRGLLASVLGHMAADFTILLAVYLHM